MCGNRLYRLKHDSPIPKRYCTGSREGDWAIRPPPSPSLTPRRLPPSRSLAYLGPMVSLPLPPHPCCFRLTFLTKRHDARPSGPPSSYPRTICLRRIRAARIRREQARLRPHSVWPFQAGGPLGSLPPLRVGTRLRIAPGRGEW